MTKIIIHGNTNITLSDQDKKEIIRCRNFQKRYSEYLKKKKGNILDEKI